MCGDEEAFFSFLSFPGTCGVVAAPLRCSSVRPSAVASPVLVLGFRGVLLVLAAVGAFIESAVEHDSYPVEDELGEQPGVVDANLATNRV